MSHIRQYGVVGVLIAVLAIVGCRSDAATEPIPPAVVAVVEVSAPTLTLEVGEEVQLRATPKSASGEVLERDVDWSALDPARARVSESGVVTGLAPGDVDIRASSEGRVGTVQLTVEAPEPPPVVAVILDVASADLEIGETIFVGARLRLATGEIVEGPVVWQSSAPLVAPVSSTSPGLGAIEGRTIGTATITASSGTIEESVTFHVAPVPQQDLIYSRYQNGRREIFTIGLGSPSVPLRLNAGDVSSDPSPSPDGLRFAFAVSQTTPIGEAQHDLYVVNRDGLQMRQLTSGPGIESEPMWSPNGGRILFTATDANLENSNIWVVNEDGTGLQNLTASLPADVTHHRNAAWSRDGSRIAFVAAREMQHKIWVMDANGANATQLTTDFGFDQSPTWSPTGDHIALTRYNNTATEYGWDVVIVAVANAATTRLALLGDQLTPAWSPDGQHIAVAGTARAGVGEHNIYTLRPDGTGLRLRTVNATWGGGGAPAWIALGRN